MSRAKLQTSEIRTSIKTKVDDNYYSTLNIKSESSPTKLSQYMKDRSVSKCKNLASMLSNKKLSKISEAKSSTKSILQSHHAISDLCDSIIQQIQNKKTQSKKTWGQQQLQATQELLRNCLNMIRGKKQQVQQSQQNSGSFLQTQIKNILKPNTPNTYFRSRANSNEFSSLKLLQKNSVTKTNELILDQSNHTLVPSLGERKSRFNCERQY